MSASDDYLAEVTKASQDVDLSRVDALVDLLAETYQSDGAVFVIGNGGSASNAAHLAQDLSKGAIPYLEGTRFRVLSLVDNVAFMTAIANDIGYERVFELQLPQFAKSGDVLIAISGSGNSPNIIAAAEYAKANGIKLVGVTGFDGGKLKGMSDFSVHVPCNNMCMSEAVHSILFHMVADLLKDKLS